MSIAVADKRLQPVFLHTVCVFLASTAAAFGDVPAIAATNSASKVDFASEVQPLLAAKCVRCHGPQTAEAGLRLGAQISYGLDSANDNLPTFVVLPDPRDLPYNGVGNFSQGLLPAANQGTTIDPSATGRNQNGGALVTWLAGAGIAAGSSHGTTDDFGYQGVEGQTYCYDLHATILHLMGIDHKQLTFHHDGIDRRITDVHGNVVHEILA